MSRVEPSSPRPGKAPLAILFGIIFLDLLGFGIIIPQLGVYGLKMRASPFMVGLLLSVYSLMQLVSAPLLGRLSDRHGRRPVLLFSVAGSVLGYVLFALADSLPVLFLARIIDGLSGGNVSTAQAYIADVTTPENRAKGMGLVGAAFGLGFLLGPAVGGLLGSLGGNLAIGLFAASLAALNWLLAFWLLPESRPPGVRVEQGRPSAGLSSALRALLEPRVGPVLGLFFLYTLAFSQMEGTFSVFLLTEHLARGAVQLSPGVFSLSVAAGEAVTREASLKVGYVFTAVGVVAVTIQGGLIGRLRHLLGEERLTLIGLLLTALGLAGLPFAPSFGWFFLPAVVMASGSALVSPSLSALLSLRAGAERQGELLGAYQSMGALGRIAGPSLGGLLFTVAAPGAPFLSAAALLACAALLATPLRRFWGRQLA